MSTGWCSPQLTKERMESGDALFFYLLLLPFCNPSNSSIAVEIKKLKEMMNTLIARNEMIKDDKKRQIFEPTPCVLMDNHFLGDEVL